jgi:hypothetical protein
MRYTIRRPPNQGWAVARDWRVAPATLRRQPLSWVMGDLAGHRMQDVEVAALTPSIQYGFDAMAPAHDHNDTAASRPRRRRVHPHLYVSDRARRRRHRDRVVPQWNPWTPVGESDPSDLSPVSGMSRSGRPPPDATGCRAAGGNGRCRSSRRPSRRGSARWPGSGYMTPSQDGSSGQGLTSDRRCSVATAPREDPSHALTAEDRRQEADAVAAEVVQESLVPRVRADHSNPASHVAHQPVPMEVVWEVRWARGLDERTDRLVHGREHLARRYLVGMPDTTHASSRRTP